jgi:ribonuclease P protein component
VVSRRVGNAVTRNRVRRRLREIVYPKLAELIGKWDLVLVARSAAAVATYRELRGAVDDLLRKARVAAP